MVWADLVGNTPIILENIVILDTLSYCNLLGDGHSIGQVFIWQFVQFLCMVYDS